MNNINLIFKYLSCETKQMILLHLYTCCCLTCSVEKICFFTNSKQSNISKHLMDLKKEKIVEFQKNKTTVQYKLSDKFKNEYSQILDFILKNKPDKKCNC